MMYSEFVAGTGCKETLHNYEVFLALEKLYMESDVTKQEIYAFGKKVVDNSKTPDEIALEKELQENYKECEKRLQSCKENLEYYELIGNKDMIKYYKNEIKTEKNRMRDIKWVLQ